MPSGCPRIPREQNTPLKTQTRIPASKRLALKSASCSFRVRPQASPYTRIAHPHHRLYIDWSIFGEDDSHWDQDYMLLDPEGYCHDGYPSPGKCQFLCLIFSSLTDILCRLSMHGVVRGPEPEDKVPLQGMRRLYCSRVGRRRV